ncbi:MAG: OmpA family protein [Pirellulales bacterium]|nr:OmpA family protein [Pirellulales bacterium]
MEEEEVPGIPEWVVTFGDMMSLLLTFFIMLVSLSEIKQNEKYQALVESIRHRFGHDTASLSMAPGEMMPRNSNLEKLASQGRALRANTMNGGAPVKAAVGEHARVEFVRPGTETVIGTRVQFEMGSSELSEQAKVQLQIATRDMIGKPQKIEVRGHTSPKPEISGSSAADNFELSYRRCRAVRDFLIELGVDEERIRPSQAGDHEPLPADLQDAARQSARVDVFLLDEYTTDAGG